MRRARDKADGRLQSVDQSLRDLDDDRLLTNQKREFDKLLPERLGLTFEQFTRAVLLAQSEFAAFLKADDNERSDLLERLTGTAEYSAISRAAYRRASEARKGVETLEAKLADDLPAEPQARAELEQQAASASALAELQQRQDRLDARQRWHDTDDRLSLAVAEGRHQQQQADAGWRELAAARADREWRRLILPSATALRARPRYPATSPPWKPLTPQRSKRSGTAKRPASRPARPIPQPSMPCMTPLKLDVGPTRGCAKPATRPSNSPVSSSNWPSGKPPSRASTPACRARHPASASQGRTPRAPPATRRPAGNAHATDG